MAENQNLQINGIALRLTFEEIFFLGDKTGLRTFPLVNREGFDGLGQSQRTAALNLAERTLTARGVYRPDDGQAPYSPVMAAILTAISQPQNALIMMLEQNEGEPPSYVQFFRADDIYLMQTLNSNGTATFELFSDQFTFEQAIRNVWRLPNNIQPAKPITLSAAEFEQLSNAAENQETQEKFLAQKGASPSSISAISQLLDHPLQAITVFAQQQQNGQGNERNLTILKNHTDAWIIEQIPTASGRAGFSLAPFSENVQQTLY